MSGGSILIVRKEDLPKTPEGFQKYVANHFSERELFDIPVYLASVRINWNYEDHEAYRRGNNRGIAPLADRVSSDYCREGLPDGQSLTDWIHQNPELVVDLTAVGEREHHSWADDD